MLTNEVSATDLNITYTSGEILNAFDDLVELAAIGAKQAEVEFDGDDLLRLLQLRKFLERRVREDAELTPAL